MIYKKQLAIAMDALTSIIVAGEDSFCIETAINAKKEIRKLNKNKDEKK